MFVVLEVLNPGLLAPAPEQPTLRLVKVRDPNFLFGNILPKFRKTHFFVVCGFGGSNYTCSTGSYKSGALCPGSTNSDTQTCSLCSGGVLYACGIGKYASGSVCSGSGTTDTQTCNGFFFFFPAHVSLVCGNGGASYTCPLGYWKSGQTCTGNGSNDTQTCSGMNYFGIPNRK